MKTKKLYCVSYVEHVTLKENESIKTHSKSKAYEIARYLREMKNTLYSKVNVYEYDKLNKYYCFKTVELL